MKALVLTEKNVLEQKQVPIPEIGPAEVLIKVAYAGICATDKEIITGKLPSPLPLIPGHEISGVVVQKGDLVKGLEVGDRVVVDPAVPCGECRFCRANKPEFCQIYREMGINVDGGWAEYVKALSRCTHKIPDVMGMKSAAIFEPMTCPFGAVDAASVNPGEQVLIIGDGAAALYFTQIVRMMGAASNTVVYKREDRVGLLKSLGAEVLIGGDEVSKLDKSHPVQSQGGFDLVIDAVGLSETVQSAVQYARIGGRIVLYGFKDECTDNFPHREIILKNLTIFGRTNSPSVWPRAIECVKSGLITLDPFVEKVLNPEDVPSFLDDFDRFAGIKAVVKWSDSSNDKGDIE